MNRKRTGKVAELDFDKRQLVNQMLRDGRTYAQIAEVMKGHGVPDLNEQNISNWFHGGFKDWLAQQERLEKMRFQKELALEIVRQNEGSQIHEATLQLAASQLYEVISETDLASLKALIADEPENYAKLVNSLAKLSKGGLEFEQYRAKVEERNRRIAAELETAKNKGGLTPETIERIERELNLL